MEKEANCKLQNTIVFLMSSYFTILQYRPVQQFTNCYGYKIQYSDASCQSSSNAPEDLSLCFTHFRRYNRKSTLKTILDVMETAVVRNGSNYQFSKLFEDASQGYEIHQVNGTFSNDMCQWNAYIDNNRIPDSVRNIFKCTVRAMQTLCLRYEGDGTATTPSASSTAAASTPSGETTGPIIIIS